jgi:hypothetical protein
MIRRGAPFVLGVEFADWWQDVSFKALPDLLAEIERALASSGYLSGLVRVYQIAGWANPFVQVEGYAGRDYGRPEDLRDSILTIMRRFYARLAWETVQFQVETTQAGQPVDVFQPSPQVQVRQAGAGETITDTIGGTIGGVLGVSRDAGLAIGAVGLVALLLLVRR